MASITSLPYNEELKESLVSVMKRMDEVIPIVNQFNPDTITSMNTTLTSQGELITNMSTTLQTLNANVETIKSDVDKIKTTLYTPINKENN